MKSTIKLTKRDTAGRRENVPVTERIILTLTLFLSFGALLIMTANLARDYLSALQFESSLDDNSWEHVHYRGDIKVTQKNENRPYSTFRYQYKTGLPFDALSDILNDPIQSIEWFAWMPTEEIQNLKEDNHYRIQLKIPYLHSHNREFLLNVSNEDTTIDQDHGEGKHRQGLFHYKSIKDQSDFPVSKDCKKGELEMDLTITSDDNGKNTDIEMRMYMNLHSKRIPTFLLNKFSLQWGTISLLKLGKICRSNLGLSDVIDTKTSFYNLFPIKR